MVEGQILECPVRAVVLTPAHPLVALTSCFETACLWPVVPRVHGPGQSRLFVPSLCSQAKANAGHSVGFQ